ncbi:hypothetical protein [Gemmata sp.]|uniref:hypothetical protein n=1 Tax=Gemmata sp. TaxID=1914242 RepID=UPI003F6F0B04
MDDHDQRFKALLHEFLPEFVALFFPNWYPRFDFSGTEWLEQESFLDPPQGDNRVLDLVARVRTREPIPDPFYRPADSSLVLINIEIESPERSTDIRGRMVWHYEALRHRYGLPVFPVCLFLRVGLDGLGWDAYEERLWDRTLLKFEYPYIGLPALDGLAYLGGDNPLGLALSALMKLPAADRAGIKAEGLAKIARSQENDAKRALLAECFDNYLELDDASQAQFEQLAAANNPETATMFNSIEARAIRRIIPKLVAEKFGPLPPYVAGQLSVLPPNQLEEIALKLIRAESLAALGLGEPPPAPVVPTGPAASGE